MLISKDDDSRLSAVLVCAVWARGATCGPTPPALERELGALAARRAVADFPPPELKDAVRAMLRAGGYKPSGRQKPASEYLAQAAREGRFPTINAAVDVNNLLSLESGLPISLLDAASVGPDALVRIAGAGESYVFNASGHEMDLDGLVCVCRRDGTPLGNPVKDSMLGKLKEDSRDFAGFIFAPASRFGVSELTSLGNRFCDLIREHCGASSAELAGIV